MILGGRVVSEESLEKYHEYLRDHVLFGFWTKFSQLMSYKDAMRDLGFRLLYYQHEPWWSKEESPWKHQIIKEFFPPNLTGQWIIDRVLNLLRCDVTHTHFGFSFRDLMELDFATFCEIEKRVTEVAESLPEAMASMKK